MADIIHSLGKDNWNYIFDTLSVNTAENLIRFNHHLESNSYSNIYIATSDYHFERVNMMVKKIIKNNNISWLLSPLELNNSRAMEKIHILNIDNDIMTALKKIE
jgi:uncharacterized SAM-binding protein YcdF (DUF218 family)